MGDINEMVIFQQDNNNEKEVKGNAWEASAIGKVIIKGRMNHDMVEKYIQFTWTFMSEEDRRIVEIDPNIFHL